MSIPIIDTHQHLWDLSKFKLPWLDAEPRLNRCHVLEDYQRAIEGLNIVKSVYMEVDVEPSQQTAEANYVLDLCDTNKAIPCAAVISGRPSHDGFAAYLDQFRDRKALKGLRQVLHSDRTPSGYCLDPKFVEGMKELGKRGLSFDLCIKPTELPNIAKLLDLAPETSFVLDHCGNASVRDRDLSTWKRDLEKVAERKNVVCKVSGIVASAAPGPWTTEDLAPIVNGVLDTFGFDRVVFGGDWPVCTLAASLKEWVTSLRSIIASRSESDQKKLLHDNAIRVYRLA